MEKIKIDYKQIPKYASENVGKTFLELVNNFFDNPENEAEFRKWREGDVTDIYVGNRRKEM